MIKQLLFSIFDNKGEAFNVPFFAPTIGLAERNFMDAVRDPETRLSAHPGDYTLWLLGEIDLATGDLVERRHLVCDGLSCAKGHSRGARDGSFGNGSQVLGGSEG